MTSKQTLYRQIPATNQLLCEPAFGPLLTEYGHRQVVDTIRHLQEAVRSRVQQQGQLPEWCQNWPDAVRKTLQAGYRRRLLPVFNLTGTVLHTNLGRALQAEAAIQAVSEAMRAPVTLEYSLDDAGRGHRDRTVASLLCEITGAEDACIVNNNAAAVMLMLAACAEEKEVIVSRGELVEIGGAFRIPDVMRQAGCQLVEVGTTNRTHLKDYASAIGEKTALLMKVHTSNYQIDGFTHAVNEAELVTLGEQTGLPVVTDLGSGSLVDLTQWGLPAEPMPQRLIAAGVSLVSFSGDKLLGGPQAGIIVGKKKYITRLQQHPLKRALRADKMTLAALEATLQLYRHPETLCQKLPTLRLLTRPAQAIHHQALRLLAALEKPFAGRFVLRVEPCMSQIGSGSLPADRLPSSALTFEPRDGRGSTLAQLSEQLRLLKRPVIGRIAEGRLWLDLRCLEEEAQFLENIGL